MLFDASENIYRILLCLKNCITLISFIIKIEVKKEKA